MQDDQSSQFAPFSAMSRCRQDGGRSGERRCRRISRAQRGVFARSAASLRSKPTCLPQSRLPWNQTLRSLPRPLKSDVRELAGNVAALEVDEHRVGLWDLVSLALDDVDQKGEWRVVHLQG